MNRTSMPTAAQSIPQWQTIYCSLMLLLVVFFVMLISFSAIDKERLQDLRNVALTTAEVSRPIPDVNRAMQSLKELGLETGMGKDFTVIRTEDGFKAVVPNPVLFASGGDSLAEGVYPILDGIIRIAQQDRLSIQVEGHTDNVPIHTAKFPSNWELSTMRAVNILRYLQQKGIPDGRLAAVGFAEYKPVTSNDTQEGRQKNRRIEILFRETR